jgi:hypothetical protein
MPRRSPCTYLKASYTSLRPHTLGHSSDAKEEPAFRSTSSLYASAYTTSSLYASAYSYIPPLYLSRATIFEGGGWLAQQELSRYASAYYYIPPLYASAYSYIPPKEEAGLRSSCALDMPPHTPTYHLYTPPHAYAAAAL